MITLILTLATMGIVGAHVTQNDEPETIIIKKEVIAYDSPKVDYSQKGAK